MQVLRLAVATRCFRQALRDSLQTASEMGAAGVQFDLWKELVAADWTPSAIRDLLQFLRELNLTVAGANFPLRRALSDPDDLDRRVQAIKAAMRFAWQLGATTITLRAGRIPEEADSKSYQLLVEVLNDLAQHGNHVGVVICLTPTWDTPAALEAFFGRITAGPLGLDFDPAHFAMTAQKPTPALRQLHRFVRHFTIRDGVKEIDGSGREVPVGQGDVDWAEMLALLGEMDYTGWGTAVRTESDQAERELRQALGFIKNLGMGLR